MSCSLLIFLVWSVIGVYRYMRMELQYQNFPLAWLSFVLFLMVYFSGLIPSGYGFTLGSRLTVSFLVGLGAMYLMVIREPKDPVVYRKLLNHARRGDIVRALVNTPRWLIILPVTTVLAIIVPFTELREVSLGNRLSVHGHYAPALLLFALRDIALNFFLNSANKVRSRADTAFFVYLAVLYVLIPLILGAARLEGLLFLFIPTFTEGLLKAIIPPLVQFLLFAFLLKLRWDRTRKMLDAS